MRGEQIKSEYPNQAGAVFWLKWVLMTTAGYSVGFLAGFILGQIGGHAVLGTVVGATAGWLQSFLLRRFLTKPARWFWASIPGPALAGLVFDLAFHFFGCRISFIYLLAATGAVTGILQSFLVMRPGCNRALIWTAVCTAAWPLSMYGFSQPLYHGAVVLVILRNAILPATTAGVILGSITGTVLTFLLRTARSQQETNIAPGGRAD